VLRQPTLEHLGEHVLGGLLVGAGRAALEVGAELPVQLRADVPPLVVVKVEPNVLAVHAYLA
jgi:hypothetical protein